jgi:hypothetical protein
MIGSDEHGNEPEGSIRGRIFFVWLSDYQLLECNLLCIVSYTVVIYFFEHVLPGYEASKRYQFVWRCHHYIQGNSVCYTTVRMLLRLVACCPAGSVHVYACDSISFLITHLYLILRLGMHGSTNPFLSMSSCVVLN